MVSSTMNYSYNPRPNRYAERYNKAIKNCKSSAYLDVIGFSNRPGSKKLTKMTA